MYRLRVTTIVLRNSGLAEMYTDVCAIESPWLVNGGHGASLYRRQMTRLSIDMIQSSQNHRCTLRRHFQLLIRAESASAAYTAVFWLELKQQTCCFPIDRS